MKKWQYKVIDLRETNLDGETYNSNKEFIAKKLNSLGKYGWEAVGIGGFGSGEDLGYHIILKRKVKK